MRRLSPVLWLLALLAVAWALRAPFLEREFWSVDEGATFTMAQQVREGAVIYRDAADNRSPLMPYLKAIVFTLAGDWNLYAQHLVVALAYGVSAFWLLALATRLGRPSVGRWAAGAFTVLALLLPGMLDSLAINTEAYVVLFSSLGFFLFARALPSGGFLSGLGIGLAFATCALCKQPGLLDFGVTWVILALLAWRQPAERARLLRLFAGSLAAFAAAAAFTCAYFYLNDAWDDFVYYAWTFNTTLYVPEVPRLERLAAIRLTWDLALHWIPAALICGFPGAYLALRALWQHLRAPSTQPLPVLSLITLGWLASGLISTTLSGRIFPHYTIQVIPGLALACGLFLARVFTLLRDPHLRPRLRLAGNAALSALFLWVGFDVRYFLGRVHPHDDPVYATLRPLIQHHTSPSDRIFVWGYQPEIYAAARRLPATRFNYTNYLTGLIPWTNVSPEIDTRYAIAPGAWEKFWQDYERSQPSLIVDALLRNYSKYPLLSQPRLRDEIVDHFAEIESATTSPLHVRLYRRLAPLDPSLATSAHVDAALQLDVAREPRQSDLIVASLSAPAGFSDVTLRLNQTPLRRLAVDPARPLDVRFLIRVSELSTHGTSLDAVARHQENRVASAPIDVARRLVLELPPHDPAPVLLHGSRRLPSNAPGWQPARRGDHDGWQHAGPFTLAFDLPRDTHHLDFLFQPPADAPDSLDLQLAVDGRPPRSFPATSTPLADGLRRLVVDLPAFRSARLTIESSSAATSWLGPLQLYARGPALRFGDRAIPPAFAVHAGHTPLPPPASDGSWDTHAFARLLYPRLPGMTGMVIDYGVRDSAYSNSNDTPPHAILEINFLHDDGRTENLLSRELLPHARPEDRGLQSTRFRLPEQGAGEIEIKFVPFGPPHPNNQTYLRRLRAQGTGPDLVISPDRVLVPVDSRTAHTDRIRTLGANGWIAHAPSRVVYSVPADLHAITFGFGLEDNAHADENGHRRSDGIEAIVEFLDADGTLTPLHRHAIDPYRNSHDRGPRHARVVLPGRAGQLVVRLSPGPHNNDAFDWSYLTNLTGEVAPAAAAP
jgi:4-amino-4-deoxy-L-arabinose transferase and related glycosyltransferases of PMT family